MLRRCVTEAKKLFDILHPQQTGQDKPTSRPKQTLSDRYKKCAEKQLALDCAVQLILEAMLENLPFRYDHFLAWAKKQGRRYTRLYKPLTKYFTKRPSRKHSICAKLHLKNNCHCSTVVTNSHSPDREVVSPTLLEIELWLTSEKERKESRHKIGLYACPACPAQLIRFSCPFAKPFVFDPPTNQATGLFLDRLPDYWKNQTDCKVDMGHFTPKFDVLDDWLDAGHTVTEFFQLLNDKQESSPHP